MLKRGRFIVLEGIDGAGTTTQAELIRRELVSRGGRVLVTAQPSEGPIGTLLRSILRGQTTREDGGRVGGLAIAGLFAADRSEHVQTIIEPALEQGIDVICDRYYHSSFAYQGLEVPIDYVVAVNGPMRTPDLIIFVDVDLKVATQRRIGRDEEVELYEVENFQARLRTAYEKGFALRDQDRYVRVDGNGSLDEVFGLIMEQVDAL